MMFLSTDLCWILSGQNPSVQESAAFLLSVISFSSSRLEELNVENIKLIEFRLKVHDTNDWMAENLVDDVFQYIP